jgi:TRAP-type C4-dicarboxylate transport system substrate-binding protein
MRAVKSICVACVCVIALVSWRIPLAAAADQPRPVELTYSIFFPATHQNSVLAMDWAREIEKQTAGRVKITVFAGGTLTPADKCYDGVEKGISDIGMSVMGYTRGHFPLSEVIDLPLGYRSGTVATELINAYYRKFHPRELDAVKIMYLHAHGPGFLHAKQAVAKLEDLKGMKIRCTGLAAKIVTALGATPVAMPMGETYDALSRGVVEGSMAPIESLQGWRWGEVVKSSTECYGAAYSTAFFVAMNKDKWNALPPDIQQTIEKVNEEWIGKTGRSWDELDRAGKAFAIGRGNQVITLTPEENARWSKAVQPILDEYVTNMKGKNLPGAEALGFCQDFLRQNSK